MSIKEGKIEDECVECGNCFHICPKHAIIIKKNTWGSGYAIANKNLCIGCDLCDLVCPVKHYELCMPIKAYAAVSNQYEATFSASGGAFYTIAYHFIEKGGVVFGAAYDENMCVKQCMVSHTNQLFRLQGSKYVKSDVADSFIKVRNLLDAGKDVLYSGTPCQIQALKNYLKNKQITGKLYTIDIICHGAPPYTLFNEYLKTLEKKYRKKIINFSFRNKKYGHKHIGSLKLENGKIKPVFAAESSYYSLFLKGKTYNRSCYSCRFANKQRCSDITLGDFWGIQHEYPDFFSINNLPEDTSVSAVMVNSEAGKNLMDSTSNDLKYYEVEYDKIVRNNPQLNKPVDFDCVAEKLRTIYINDHYEGIEKYFNSNRSLSCYYMRVASIIPLPLKKFIKKMMSFK